jgi:hypothetical protein
MPLYPVHIAASRHDPLPPVAELTAIEADSPQEALERLKREPLAMSGGEVKTVWLRVVVTTWPNGNARQVLSTEVPVEAIHRSN